MKNLWYIAKKDLLQILKDRDSLFFLLLVPLVLIVVVGFAFGNLFGNGSSQITITVNQYNDPSQVTDQVANNSNVNAGVVIPAVATAKIVAAAQTGVAPNDLVQFYTLPSNNDARPTIVQNIVSQVLSSQFAGISAVGQ